MTTIHAEAQFLLSLYAEDAEQWMARHPRCPRLLAERIVAGKRKAALRRAARKSIDRAAEMQTAHLDRDYRPGIGSGRASDWHAPRFRRVQVAAAAIHAAFGIRGDELRRIAHACARRENTGRPCDPAHYAVAEAAWAESEGRAIVAGSGTISGYLADSILSWRQGESGYEGCSGCQAYRWIRQHPETWDALMMRAPVGASGDGWEQCYPHERERAAACIARGWHHTMRLSDSIYSRRHPITGAARA